MSEINKESELAFKDFKNAVTVKEFEAVLSIAKKEYSDLEKVLESRSKFLKKASEAERQIKEQSLGMPPGLARKLLEGLERRADKDITGIFSDRIARHKDITDFINRFQSTESEYPYLDFSFLNKKQKQ